MLHCEQTKQHSMAQVGNVEIEIGEWGTYWGRYVLCG
jgi:hypothetical protein